jgi:hypothetical protein
MLKYNKIITLLLLLITLSCAVKPKISKGERSTILNTRFPLITAETLAKNKIEFPTDNLGKPSILVIAFEGDAQKIVDTWTNNILKRYDDKISYFEIPMIAGTYKIIKNVIDNGMRGGVAKELHNNVATYYGSLSEYKTNLKMNNKDTIYIYLLDKNGNIVWFEEGFSDENKLNDLDKNIQKLL